MQIIPTAKDDGAAIKVNGKPVKSGEPSEDMSITVGQELTATIEVTAENGTVKTYTLTVTVNQ